MNEASTRKRMGLVVALIVLTALVVALVAALPTPEAGATDNTTEGDCTTFYNHSGHIPGSYDYAEFLEDGQLITTAQTNGEDIFVDPAQYDAGESWDQVNKCHNGDTTTTTIEEETTTTPEETTTTLPEESTTTTVPETTTLPIEHGAFWSASSECLNITAEWSEESPGIVQIDVYQRLPEGDFGPADGVVPFTESGQVISTEGALADSEWILIPVVETGFVAVPDQISLFTEVCEDTTVTTNPPPTDSTLPFTGISRMTIYTLLAVAGIATVLGSIFVIGARRNQELDA